MFFVVGHFIDVSCPSQVSIDIYSGALEMEALSFVHLFWFDTLFFSRDHGMCVLGW